MNILKFKQELLRAIEFRMPLNNEYIPSRRIEGYIEPGEDKRTFREFLFIIDSDLGDNMSKLLLSTVYDILYKQPLLREGYYSYVVWTTKGLDTDYLIRHKYTKLYYLYKYLNTLKITKQNTGSWDKLTELYKPFTSVGQSLIFTTQKKVEELDKYRFPYTKKTMVIFPSDESFKTSKVIRNELCLGLTVLPDKNMNERRIN